MTDAQRIKLKYDVSIALGIRPEYGPLILATEDGKVRRILTAFGDPIPGWLNRLEAAGIPCAPDHGVNGGPC